MSVYCPFLKLYFGCRDFACLVPYFILSAYKRSGAQSTNVDFEARIPEFKSNLNILKLKHHFCCLQTWSHVPQLAEREAWKWSLFQDGRIFMGSSTQVERESGHWRSVISLWHSPQPFGTPISSRASSHTLPALQEWVGNPAGEELQKFSALAAEECSWVCSPPSALWKELLCPMSSVSL